MAKFALTLLLLLGAFVNLSFCQKLYGLTKPGIVFLENLNSSETKTLLNDGIVLDSLREKKNMPNRRQSSQLLARETDTLNTKVYLLNSRKLIVKYCGMALFEHDILLWGHNIKDCISNSSDYAVRGNAIIEFFPVFSKNLNSLIYADEYSPLFINRSAMVELNLNTGEKNVVIKKAFMKSSYSPDERYILLQDMRDSNRYFVYDRILKRIVRKYKDILEMTWLD